MHYGKKKSRVLETAGKYKEVHHIFVVLATAVAEVGRDHDYDWAIIEPSSMRSIIQLAGRVQRHRKQEPKSENIHVLSKNYKGLKGKDYPFTKPGFEKSYLSYKSHDLEKLNLKKHIENIDSNSRILKQEVSRENLKKEKEKKYICNDFTVLEHFAQNIRLNGLNITDDFAALWWTNQVSWCGELQERQPFRKSIVNDEFYLQKTRNGFIWCKKTPKTFPVKHNPTLDIHKKPEKVPQGNGISFWGDFDMEQELEKLSKLKNKSINKISEIYTLISPRKLDEYSSNKWQYHSKLGLYEQLMD
jgi:CRISPR-associated endonuclease/helicase Cas3